MVLRWQLFIMALVFSAFFSYKKTKNYHISAFLLLLLAMALAVNVSFDPKVSFDIVSLRLRLVSARALILIVSSVYIVSKVESKKILNFLELASAINAIVMMIIGYGIFNVNSLDLTFSAMIFPSLILRKRKLDTGFKRFLWISMIGANAIAFIITPASTHFFCLFLAFGAYFFKKKQWEILIPGTTLIAVSGWLINREKLVSGEGRLEIWDQILGWWINSKYILLGTGTGTFEWVGPLVQCNGNIRNCYDQGVKHIFSWLHNDWFQILLEQGVIGFVLAVWLFFVCFKKSLKMEAWVMPTIVSIWFAMIPQFPFRFVLSQVLIVTIIKICMEVKLDDSEKTEKSIGSYFKHRKAKIWKP